MTKLVNTVLLVLVLTLEWTTPIPLEQACSDREQDCPDKCVCYPNNSRQVVECTDIKASELNTLSGATTDLILKHGSWESIDFGDLSHLTKLLTISIYNYTTAHLKRYKDSKKKQIFKEVLNISIQYTKIDSIRAGVFEFFPNATHFILSYNCIDNLYGSVFKGLGYIEFIDLSNNQIETVAHDTFINHPHLKTLDLSNNTLITSMDICALKNSLPSTLILSRIQGDECSKVRPFQYEIIVALSIIVIATCVSYKCIYNTKSNTSKQKQNTKRQIEPNLEKKLGHNVYEGKIVEDGTVVAVKISDLNPFKKKIEEIDVLIQLSKDGKSHDNVIQYKQTEVYEGKRYIALMPVCDETLYTAINTKNNTALKYMSSRRDSCLEQLAKGLMFLHEHDVQHRDIKPENILIKYEKSTVRFIISDFDIGHITGKQSHHKTGYGTEGWVAPELWGTATRNPTVDIFSMGCVFYYALTQGTHPIGKITTEDERIKCQQAIQARTPPKQENIELILEHNFTKMRAKNLIECMLRYNENERPSASEVLDHPFFWDDEKVCNTYTKMGNKFDDKGGTKYENLRKYMRENSHKVFTENWKNKIKDNDIRNSVRSNQETDICELIKAIRNKLEHSDRILANSPKQAAIYKNKQGIRRYWEIRFPRLLIEMYYALKMFDDSQVDSDESQVDSDESQVDSEEVLLL